MSVELALLLAAAVLLEDAVMGEVAVSMVC